MVLFPVAMSIMLALNEPIRSILSPMLGLSRAMSTSAPVEIPSPIPARSGAMQPSEEELIFS